VWLDLQSNRPPTCESQIIYSPTMTMLIYLKQIVNLFVKLICIAKCFHSSSWGNLSQTNKNSDLASSINFVSLTINTFWFHSKQRCFLKFIVLWLKQRAIAFVMHNNDRCVYKAIDSDVMVNY